MNGYGGAPDSREPAGPSRASPAEPAASPAEPAAPPAEPAAPPTGPGVVPPFAAPPTDGIRRRMWLGLIAGTVALVIVCVGGLGGCIALGLTAEKARTNAATKVVTDFLTAWQQDKYSEAYQLTCDDFQRQVNLANFTGELSSRPLAGFTLGTVELTTSAAIVPARLRFAEGGFGDQRYQVVVNKQGRSVVCGTV